MKSSNAVVFVLVMSFCVPWAVAQEQQKPSSVKYHVTDLGTLGGPFSEATSVANDGLVSGAATLPDGSQHATLWYGSLKADLGTLAGAGKKSAGLNSSAFTVNDFAQAVGASELSKQDKDSENFCGFGTGLRSLPFLWQDEVMKALPTFGGRNGQAISINNRGLVVGVAEEAGTDVHCVAPQTHDFESVIWGPAPGEIQKLRPLPGDTVGIGLWINHQGQAVGQSGSCGNTLLPPLAVGPHSVLWENGAVIDLGNLGGACLTPCKSAALGPLGNTALYINERGQVVGTSALTGEETMHAFLWTKLTGMQDLGTVPGDFASVALSVNEHGEVVGLSIDKTGVPRAFLRRHGRMIDLNSLFPADAPIHALVAEVINSRGEISGFGVTSSGQTHGFLATPYRP